MSYLSPETKDAMFARIERLLHALEVSSLVGLSRVRFAWSTVDAENTGGIYYTGPAAAEWQDDRGNVGTGWPQVTLAHGRKVLMFMQHEVTKVANDPTFRTYTWVTGIGPNGPYGFSPLNPRCYVSTTRGPSTEGYKSTELVAGRMDLTPTTTNFRMFGIFPESNPAAPNISSVIKARIFVVPLD